METVRIQADIAIVAAGPSGLAAAITAAERGYRAVVFEKSSTPGGTANMGMGPFGVESRIQKASMINLTKEEAFRIHMEYAHWNVDAHIVHDYFWKSGSTIDWLEDMGVVFAGATRYYPNAYQTWHVVQPADGSVPGPRAAGTMIKVMYARAEELGVEFHFDAPVQRLLRDENGVYGYEALGKDGTSYQVEADAVLVATGGFGDNPEMIAGLCGYTYGADMFNFRIPGVNGDGLRMMWDVGAMRTRPEMEKILSFGPVPAADLPTRLFVQPTALIVNRSGERVFDETCIDNTSVAANVVAAQQDRCVYSVIDNRLVEHYRSKGVDYPNGVRRDDPTVDFEASFARMEQEHPECVFSAASIEELAEKTGVRATELAETFRVYNDSCRGNYDDLYGKHKRYLRPLDEGERLYCIKLFPGAYGSLGGVKVNYRYQVLDENYEPIEGLYASGSDVNSLYGDTYLFLLPGNTMGFALNSGRIAAEHMTDFLAKLDATGE